MDKKEIEKRFTYHPPRSNQIQRYEYIRDWAKWLALHICDMTPESREQSLAITALEECVMWANAAIARNEAPGEGIILPDKNTLYPDVLTTSQAEGSTSPASQSWLPDPVYVDGTWYTHDQLKTMIERYKQTEGSRSREPKSFGWAMNEKISPTPDQGSSPSEPTGDYQIRDHVSYAVGDPYGMFDYIPHVVMPDGGVLMSQDAIEEAWRRSHDFEPLEGWKGSRYSESEGGE